MLLHSIAPDLQPTSAPADAWNACSNVAFKDGQARRMPGDTPTLPGTGAVECLLYVEVAGAGRWIAVHQASIVVSDGATNTVITPAGWAPAAGSIYTATVVNGLAVINNSSQHPVYWPGGGLCLPLPGWPAAARCNAMRGHKGFLFAIGIVASGGNEVWWSDIAGPGAVPQVWVPAEDNLAGSVNLAPLYDPCLDALTMRDDLLIYKRQSIWAATLIGGSFVFNFRTLFEEAGLAATNALCRGPNDEHLFVASVGDVYINDGVRCGSVLEGRAQRTFYANYSSQPDAKALACTLQRTKQALIVTAQQGSSQANVGVVYDFVSGDLGQRPMPVTLCLAAGGLLDPTAALANQWNNDNAGWDTDTTQWNEALSAQTNDDVLAGTGAGVFCVTDPSADADWAGNPVVASLSKTGIVLDPSRQSRQLLKRLRPDIQGNEGTVLTFRLSSQDAPNGPVTLGPQVPWVVGQQSPAIDTFLTGRYLGVEIVSSGGEPWVLGNIELETQAVGQW